jgi:hypothetical protein
MTEQLVLHQVHGDGSAVHRFERVAAPRTETMNEPRADFLAGAGLPGDEHAGVALGEQGNILNLVPQSRAFTDEVGEAEAFL